MDTNIINAEKCFYCMAEFGRRSVNENAILLRFNNSKRQILLIQGFYTCLKGKIMRFMY
jgi:hypothetical protein